MSSMGVYAHLCLFHKIISDIFAKMQLNLTSHALDLSFKLRDRLWLAGVNLGFHKSLQKKAHNVKSHDLGDLTLAFWRRFFFAKLSSSFSFGESMVSELLYSVFAGSLFHSQYAVRGLYSSEELKKSYSEGSARIFRFIPVEEAVKILLRRIDENLSFGSSEVPKKPRFSSCESLID